jgi:hypothetical protein
LRFLTVNASPFLVIIDVEKYSENSGLSNINAFRSKSPFIKSENESTENERNKGSKISPFQDICIGARTQKEIDNLCSG